MVDLCRMARRRNPNWGKMLHKYIAQKMDKKTADKLYKDGTIAKVLRDGKLSAMEVALELKVPYELIFDVWQEMSRDECHFLDADCAFLETAPIVGFDRAFRETAPLKRICPENYYKSSQSLCVNQNSVIKKRQFVRSMRLFCKKTRKASKNEKK